MSEFHQSNSGLLTPVYQFHQYTKELLALARAGDWEAFERESPRREALIEPINDSEFLLQVAKAGLDNDLRAEIAEIQVLNDELTSLAEKTKSEVAQTLRDQKHKDRAVQAYQPKQY